MKLDKFERVLTQILVVLSWYCWKVSILPSSRVFWKKEHMKNKKELKNDND
jgi:hypothetical protein